MVRGPSEVSPAPGSQLGRWRRPGRIPVAALAIAVGTLAACSGDSEEADRTAAGESTSRVAAETVVVYRTASCGCCKSYVEYLRHHGFEVQSEVVDETATVRARYGVPDDGAGCHTSVIGGYAVEGHVPVTGIEKLLNERPDIDGITVPGMPQDSPGMGGDGVGLEVLAIDDGALAPFTTG